MRLSASSPRFRKLKFGQLIQSNQRRLILVTYTKCVPLASLPLVIAQRTYERRDEKLRKEVFWIQNVTKYYLFGKLLFENVYSYRTGSHMHNSLSAAAMAGQSGPECCPIASSNENGSNAGHPGIETWPPESWTLQGRPFEPSKCVRSD